MPMSPRLLRPRQTGFDPRSIAGLQLWLDASDALTMTLNGSTVSEWRSKAGNIVLAQSTASSQPTLTNNYFAGRSALTFDGADNLYSASAPLSIAPSASFLVFDETSLVNFARVLVGSPATGDDFASLPDRFETSLHNGHLNRAIRRGAQPLTAASVGIAADSQSISSSAFGKLVVSINVTSSTALVRANGVDGILDSAHTQSGSSIGTLVGTAFLGGVPTTSLGFIGRMCEILHYSRNLSTAEVQRIERWLASRWGVTL